jgi:2-dehydro-3-deoxyphosphooctonate aldolase (KDO 8-P synthase)
MKKAQNTERRYLKLLMFPLLISTLRTLIWLHNMWTYYNFNFLVRQTDLVVAAANTGKVVNLKRWAESMKHAVQKVLDCNNQNVWSPIEELCLDTKIWSLISEEFLLCNNMRPTDVTHSLQQPNQTAGVTGGRPDMIETAQAGIAVG